MVEDCLYTAASCPVSFQLLPRYAMHKRGLCRRAVGVYPSVRPSVRHIRVCPNE